MQIANPIYDAVFKFMMNDNKVAKLLLSAILGEEIIELKFRPTEFNIPLKEALTVLKMDFSALVKHSDGSEKLVIIEIQKAKLHTDIMRFRRYLGKQYLDENNAVEVETIRGIKRQKAFPIISIYFLGQALENTPNIPVIKVARQYINLATGEALSHKEEFIESLTHDSYVIQIPFIEGNRGTELEQVLSIFDQKNIDKDYHILNVKEEDFSEKYKPVIRRLIHAVVDKQTRDYMSAEDEIIGELQAYARLINEKEVELRKVNEEKQAAEKEKQAVEKEKQAAELTINNTVKHLHTGGMSIRQISKITGLTNEKIQQIITSK
ncbi:MAG: hypothetical protein AB8G86_21865 [Saprospiraceae bacterium]